MLDKLFGLDKSHDITEGDEVDLLTTVYDQGELAIVRSVLEAENIPYLVRERGSGSVVKIVTGFTMYGTDVFIPSAAMERAREVFDALEAYDDTQAVEELPGDKDGGGQ